MGEAKGTKTALVVLLLISTAFFVGCSDNSNNSALNILGSKNVKNDALGVIVNNPAAEVLEKISNLKKFEYEKNNGSLLIIPTNNSSNIAIKTLVMDSNKLKEKETIYMEDSSPDGFGLLLKAYRPEGVPSLKICINSKDGNGEYILSYNGKDGTPDIEFILRD